MKQRGPNYFVLREAPVIELEAAADDGLHARSKTGTLQKDSRTGAGHARAERSRQGRSRSTSCLNGGYGGGPDEFPDSNVPLMSTRLKETIEAAGVDNVNFYPDHFAQYRNQRDLPHTLPSI